MSSQNIQISQSQPSQTSSKDDVGTVEQPDRPTHPALALPPTDTRPISPAVATAAAAAAAAIAAGAKPTGAITAGPPGASGARKLELGGDAVRLDELGPVVVNKDGTISRVADWSEMSEIERKNTIRFLGRRNEERRAALRAQAEQERQA